MGRSELPRSRNSPIPARWLHEPVKSCYDAPEGRSRNAKGRMMPKAATGKTLFKLALVCSLAMLSSWTEARPPQSPAAPADVEAHAAELLAARERGQTPLLDDLRELCDGIGGRPTGSKACDRAVDWAVARFRAAGVESTWTETYTIPGSWAGGADHAECLAPAEFPIRVAAGPFTAPTPGGHALEAPLVNAGDGSAESFARLGDKARGAIALVLSPEMKTEADLFAEYGRDGPMFAAAREGRCGRAAGAVHPAGRAPLSPPHGMGQLTAFPFPPPSWRASMRHGWHAFPSRARFGCDWTCPAAWAAPFKPGTWWRKYAAASGRRKSC